MAFRPTTSRHRYRQYRRDFKANETEGTSRSAAAHAKRKGRGGQRSFFQLFAAFFGLIRGHRHIVAFSLLTVTIATGLKLIPPAAIGFTLDYLLGEQPLPTALLAAFHLPAERRELLTLIALGLIIIATVSLVIGMSGRYLNTLTTKRIQARIRKRVFEHAVRRRT